MARLHWSCTSRLGKVNQTGEIFMNNFVVKSNFSSSKTFVTQATWQHTKVNMSNNTGLPVCLLECQQCQQSLIIPGIYAQRTWFWLWHTLMLCSKYRDRKLTKTLFVENFLSKMNHLWWCFTRLYCVPLEKCTNIWAIHSWKFGKSRKKDSIKETRFKNISASVNERSLYYAKLKHNQLPHWTGPVCNPPIGKQDKQD